MSDGSKPLAFVGDLHGRVSLLNTILARDPDRKYHYIFVGDIIHHKPFFRRNPRVSPVKILRTVADMVESGGATLLLGNNENYILNSLITPPEKIKKREAKYTLKCLKELDLEERLKYINLLSSAPLSLEIDNYRIAHAYYPHEGQGVSRETNLYGPGYVWFRDPDLSRHCIDPNYRYFFGHYGLPYWHKNVNIIDATSLEAVGVYYSDRDEFMLYY